MSFSKKEIVDIMEEYIILDVNSGQSAIISDNENNFINYIGGLSIGWDKIKEVKLSK